MSSIYFCKNYIKNLKELELALKNKLIPLTANKSVLKYPVEAQRLKAEKLTQHMKKNNTRLSNHT